MDNIELILDTFENTISEDFYLDRRITSAMLPLTNIPDNTRKETIENPYYFKHYRIDDKEMPGPKSNNPLYNFAEYLDRRIDEGTINIRSGIGYLIESLKFSFNTLVLWGSMPTPHIPYPYAFMHLNGRWMEVEPKEEGLFCLHESDIFDFEYTLRRALIDSRKDRSDWEKYLHAQL